MKKCPIKPKTSDLTAGSGQQSSSKQPNWGSLAGLAKLQGCSQRTIREWCKQGLIPEAYQTPGGHWRIRMPLSIKTRYELEKRSADWPFKGMKGDIGGDFSPDLAEWLMLAQLYQVDVGEEVPVLTIAELGDPLYEGLIEEPTSGKASIARQFQDEIIQRLETGQSFSDLLFLGWVYQFWRKNERRPTVAEVGELMGLSRGACYRRGHTAKEVNKAYLTATGELKRSLPDPSGLDSIQRASLEAKKPGFSKLHHDPYSDD